MYKVFPRNLYSTECHICISMCQYSISVLYQYVYFFIVLYIEGKHLTTVQITFIFIDFRVCDFAFAFKTPNAPCVSRFKRVLFSDRFQFAF